MKRTTRFLLVYGYLLFSINYTFLLADNNNIPKKKWSIEKKILLPSPRGNTEAFTWRCPKAWDEKPNVSSLQLVYVPSNGLLWYGRPTPHIFITNNKIVGVYAVGVNLFLISSSTKVIGLNLRPNNVDLGKYGSTCPAEWNIEPNGIDKQLNLDAIVGEHFLQDIRSSHPPFPIKIYNITCDKSNVILSMTSEIGKRIVLKLNQELEPISATVDGKQVYPKLTDP